MSHTKKIVLSAIMVSVGILLPMAFHAIPNAGLVFAPMHLPVLLTGFICGPMYGVFVGIVCPVLSFIMTGMPTAANLPNMLVELFFYGACTGIFFRLIKTKKLIFDIIIALLISMLIGRIAGGIIAYLLFLGGKKSAYSWNIFFTGYFVTCLPAIIIQIVTVPAVVGVACKINFLTESDRRLFPSQRKKRLSKSSILSDLK